MSEIARKQVVLSLFPGADLFGRAFEELGFCVVRGPEKLLGQDIRDFHVPVGRFDGVIGGPPCQVHSKADAMKQSKELDLTGEFRRVFEESKAEWMVMENVAGVRHSPFLDSSWVVQRLCDWDCGGKTLRTRLFHFWPQELGLSFQLPQPRAEKKARAQYGLCASDGRHTKKGMMVGTQAGISLPDACELHGFPGLFSCGDRFMTKGFGIHLLGNGVPRAMGLWVARNVLRWLENRTVRRR